MVKKKTHRYKIAHCKASLPYLLYSKYCTWISLLLWMYTKEKDVQGIKMCFDIKLFPTFLCKMFCEFPVT